MIHHFGQQQLNRETCSIFTCINGHWPRFGLWTERRAVEGELFRLEVVRLELRLCKESKLFGSSVFKDSTSLLVENCSNL